HYRMARNSMIEKPPPYPYSKRKKRVLTVASIELGVLFAVLVIWFYVELNSTRAAWKSATGDKKGPAQVSGAR
ncbi:MAG: hypothetical protein ACREDR_29300, partial [Blastocatellia bacterium]